MPATLASASLTASALASHKRTSRLIVTASVFCRKRSSWASAALVETVAIAMMPKMRPGAVNGPPFLGTFSTLAP